MDCVFCRHGHGCPYVTQEDMLHVFLDHANNDPEGRVVHEEVRAGLEKISKLIRKKYVRDHEFRFNLNVSCDCDMYESSREGEEEYKKWQMKRSRCNTRTKK